MSDLKHWTFAGSVRAGDNKVNLVYKSITIDGIITGYNGTAICIVKLKQGGYNVIGFYTATNKDGGVAWDYKETLYNKENYEGGIYKQTTRSGNGSLTIGVGEDYFYSTIPIFNEDDTEGINNYRKNGDDSGKINAKMLATDWTLAIDGTKSPLYKLLWSNKDIFDNISARIRIGYGGYDDISGKVSIHKWQLVDYSPSHFNTNYAQINNAVWGEIANIVSPVATLSTVYIAVQLEYYETPTVLPSDSSSIMFCELFKNQKNGNMYGDIGFLEKDENGLYDKVTSGDGSTFTVKVS